MFQVTQEANSGLLSTSIGGATHSHVCAKDTVKVPPFALKLSDSLESFVLSPGTALLQYADLQSDQWAANTVKLLKYLAKTGHKVSLPKLQFVQKKVVLLGHVITSEGKTLSPKRVDAIQNLPKPVTKKQMMSFLDMCSYCRLLISNYAILEAPLASLIHGKGLQAQHKITWTLEVEQSFTELKLALQSIPTLGLPDPTKRFTQTVDEKDGCMTSVLLQDHGNKLRPVAYFSLKLDPVAAGLQRYIQICGGSWKFS